MADYSSDDGIYWSRNVFRNEKGAQSCNFMNTFTEVRQATPKADKDKLSNTANWVPENLTRGPELRSVNIILDEDRNLVN